jgi:hypothetical protein
MFRANAHDEVAVLHDQRTRNQRSDKTSGRRRSRGRSGMRRFLRENGLSIAAFSLFFVCLVGQFAAGLADYNNQQREHQQPTVGVGEYVRSGHFIEATFENWESEFLQMAAFVVLTVMLRQKGSPESKELDAEEEVDEDPRRLSPQKRAKAPWPVRRGGFVLTLYEHSLSLALLLLFLLSFVAHALGGAAEYNQEQLAHGGQTLSSIDYFGTARFWFESFQNWQSEFLSVGWLFVLTIFLREKGSPQSKPVAAPHSKTGMG